MFCTKCGNKLEPESKFCTNCGNPVEAPSAPEPVIEPATETTPTLATSPQPTFVTAPLPSNDDTKKKKIKLAIIISSISVAVIALVLILILVIIPSINTKKISCTSKYGEMTVWYESNPDEYDRYIVKDAKVTGDYADQMSESDWQRIKEHRYYIRESDMKSMKSAFELLDGTCTE